jgi:hypothetical protein
MAQAPSIGVVRLKTLRPARPFASIAAPANPPAAGFFILIEGGDIRFSLRVHTL